jgi:hypothetical protein
VLVTLDKRQAALALVAGVPLQTGTYEPGDPDLI